MLNRSRFFAPLAGVAALAAISLLPASLLAHHSFSAEYDADQPISVTGVVTKVQWQNPHVWFYLDVTNEDGSHTEWAFSGGAPGQLFRRGITKANIPIGATISVDGFRAKDGSHNGNGRRVVFQDGTSVFTAGDPGPDKGKGPGAAQRDAKGPTEGKGK